MPQKRPRAEASDALTDLGEALITVRVCTNLMKEFGDGSEDDSATTTDEDMWYLVPEPLRLVDENGPSTK